MEALQVQKEMESPVTEFRFGQSVLKFQLRIALDDENIVVGLVNLNEGKLRSELAFKAICCGSGSQLGASSKVERTFESSHDCWGFPSLFSLEAPSGGPVKFACDFTVTIYEEFSGPVLGTGADIVHANAKLLRSGLFSDLTVSCEEEHFKCHKAILAARSKYFESMFSSDMVESSQSSIVMNDISAKAFAQLLEFIYTGSLSDSSDLESVELLTLADRFMFDDLKLACEVAISKTVGMSNAVELLSISHTYSAKELQKAAASFVNANRQMLSKSEEWFKMVKANPGALEALVSE